MNRKEVLELMQFVIDQNANVLAEATGLLNMGDQERRTVLNAVESKTKDSFFRYVDRMSVDEKKSKRSKK